MSAQTLSPAAGPADLVAATQRVTQLQEMIARSKQGSSPTSFADALNTASQAPAGAAVAAIGTAGSAPALALGTPAGATPAVALGTPAGATPSLASGSASTPYDQAITQAAARYNVDPAVLHGLIQQESGFDPNSRSNAGALGLTQLMPGTASSLGVTNPLDPIQSIEGGARYLSQMMSQFGGNTADALAAYNAGAGAVHRYGGVPPYAETQDYVNKVLGYANAYRQSLSSAPTSAPTGSIA